MSSDSPLIQVAAPPPATAPPVAAESKVVAIADDPNVRFTWRGRCSSSSDDSCSYSSQPKVAKGFIATFLRRGSAAGAAPKVEDEAKATTSSHKSSTNQESIDLGNYLMFNTIVGRGGFAHVREGLNRETREHVAIKPIPLAQESVEVQISLSLSHPSIVTFYGVKQVNNIAYLIMERAPYNTLREVRKNYKKRVMDPWKTKYFCEQIADGLSYLHGINICHRDIKLSNVLMTENQRVKIADFGLAAYCHDGDREIIFTQSVGTMEYKAPELMAEAPYKGPGVDLWALGVLMLFLHTGEKLWNRPVFTEGLLRDIDLGKQRKLTQHVTNELVRHCIMQLLRLNPKDRDTAARMVYKLRRDRKSRNQCCDCICPRKKSSRKLMKG